MKEFALRHPILTFLLADTLIEGLVYVLSGKGRKPIIHICKGYSKEEENNGSADDDE